MKKLFRNLRKLFASRRGVDHVARSRVGRRECYTTGGQFAVAEDNRAADPTAKSGPRFLHKFFIKPRGFYDLAEEEGKAVERVQEIHPGWQPEEPRPFVVFSEWKRPIIIFDHSEVHYIRFYFPMRTRDDLVLDLIRMPHQWLVWKLKLEDEEVHCAECVGFS
ncbi:hypothetical protein NPIL_307631 [Nephila pilipes]|uniref:Uncharacterized protein n=1 Tax=Nephila pilipes TaxID=299642 RepID=A0A8X6Q5Z4_NEPPI|nr:hypothetical protein NPIL_307631 [Nephila pilipes]